MPDQSLASFRLRDSGLSPPLQGLIADYKAFPTNRVQSTCFGELSRYDNSHTAVPIGEQKWRKIHAVRWSALSIISIVLITPHVRLTHWKLCRTPSRSP